MGDLYRIMGIDHGEKRIGIALSDPFRNFASPNCIIEQTTDAEVFAQIQAIIQSEQVKKIVIGLPTGTDGGIGMQGQIVLHWARAFADTLALPIVFWDESYSSTDVKAMQSRTKKKKNRRRYIDDLAAAAILQEYLQAGEFSDEPGQPLETYRNID